MAKPGAPVRSGPGRGSTPGKTAPRITWLVFDSHGDGRGFEPQRRLGAASKGIQSAARLADWYRIRLETRRRRGGNNGAARRFALRQSDTWLKGATPRRVAATDRRASQIFVTRGILVTISFRLRMLSAPTPHARRACLADSSRGTRGQEFQRPSHFFDEEHLVDARPAGSFGCGAPRESTLSRLST
jgi:hypothetical protein